MKGTARQVSTLLAGDSGCAMRSQQVAHSICSQECCFRPEGPAGSSSGCERRESPRSYPRRSRLAARNPSCYPFRVRVEQPLSQRCSTLAATALSFCSLWPASLPCPPSRRWCRPGWESWVGLVVLHISAMSRRLELLSVLALVIRIEMRTYSQQRACRRRQADCCACDRGSWRAALPLRPPQIFCGSSRGPKGRGMAGRRWRLNRCVGDLRP
jgi:hypothetical protein